MQTLSIDIETYSSVDIKKSGVYKYAAAPDFQVMLFAYSFAGGPVQILDLTKDKLSESLVYHLTNAGTLKTAFNAAFERTCLSRHLGVELDPAQWDCTMVRAGRAGFPMSLGTTAKALRLEQEKMTSGAALIRYFSIPCKPTKANGGRERNMPGHAPEKWEEFKAYCVQDVVVETSIRDIVEKVPVTDFETKLWQLDQKINDKGVGVDMQFVENALRINASYVDHLHTEATEITGLDNPNSVAQLVNWLNDNGEEVETLRKADVKELLAQLENRDICDGNAVKRILEIRQEMAKTSVKKYQAMQDAVGKDGRIRGLLQFYGANRTGRWAGRLVQVQNLPQNHIHDLDLARSTVREGDGEWLEMLYGNVPDTLSQLIRTAFIAGEWHRFIVADFSAIEARVIAWFAGEKWRMDVFATHGKIYEASASQMFKVPIESIKKGSDLRQKGKVSELALGYQGGTGALITMGALNMGLTEEELPELVQRWRDANPAIVNLWQQLNTAALTAIVKPGSIQAVRFVKMQVKNGNLLIQLPSGRLLCYVSAKTGVNRFGGRSIIYQGMDQTTKQWTQQETYGGKIAENIVQAIARDCLALAMMRMDEAGYEIVMHVHDEIVMEVPYDFGSTAEVDAIMSEPINWAPGLPLTAESFETIYYKKD